MRRVILPMIALTLAAAPAVVEAQTPRPERGQMAVRAPFAGNPAARVLAQREALGLTGEQVARLEQLQAEYAARNEPLLQQVRAARADLPRGERRPATAERRAEMRERMAQLTPEQRQEMRQRREQMASATPEERQRMREEMRQRMEAMTPEQREAMRQRMLETRAARSLTAEQRAQLEALRPVMEQLRANAAEAREQVQQVLTDEQRTRLQELRQERMRKGGEPGARRDARARRPRG